MPEIPLLNRGKPFGPVATFFVLQAIMLSPKDLGSAESFLAITAGSSTYSKLLADTISKFAKASTGGAIAGDVFLHLLQLHLHRPQDASVGKAVFIVSRELEKTTLHSGKVAPSNVDRVHAFWAKFRPAAPLWAAFRLAQDGGRTSLSSMPADSEFAALSDNLILCADTLLIATENAKLTFDPDPWKLPDGYQRKPFSVDVPPPTPETIKLLAEYRAPNTPK
jgi:hypothetical protein